MKKLTYLIGACSEHIELKHLLNTLKTRDTDNTEIKLVLDKPTQQVKDIAFSYLNTSDIHFHEVNNDFSKHKNYMNAKCKGEFIFNIDADEYPNKYLHENILDIIKENVDLIWIPRINVVNGITLQHLKAWNWQITLFDELVRNEDRVQLGYGYVELLEHYHLILRKGGLNVEYKVPVINFPDIQGRIYKNNNRLHWSGKVHESIINAESQIQLPSKFDMSLMHVKDINKQVEQNKMYNSIK